MDDIRAAAVVSVGRGTGFAGLAIFTTMFALSYDAGLATAAGSVLCFITSGVLFFLGDRALSINPRQTELWAILRKEARPPAAIAQRVVGAALRDAYFHFGRATATVTMALWVVSLFLRVIF